LNSELPTALRESEKRSKARKEWKPARQGADPTGRGVVGVMDEELGYESTMRETLD
jgi:hypothetical protein